MICKKGLVVLLFFYFLMKHILWMFKDSKAILTNIQNTRFLKYNVLNTTFLYNF